MKPGLKYQRADYGLKEDGSNFRAKKKKVLEKRDLDPLRDSRFRGPIVSDRQRTSRLRQRVDGSASSQERERSEKPRAFRECAPANQYQRVLSAARVASRASSGQTVFGAVPLDLGLEISPARSCSERVAVL